ncbi:universal stress protein [Salinarimonas chemoclinalis]|uniref:universal stress protein n=1 Tax=Salinarimonas chemoclinalis TaxID=3241599 RepID=UPI00355830BB
MYSKILTPVDLAHRERLAKAVDTAVDLARHWGIPVVLVGVTEAAPSAVARNPQEYARELAAVAEETARATGVAVEARTYTAHDPATQIDDTILKAVADTGADLVVMASHAPTVGDALVPSHGGRLASHAAISVFLVR